MFNCLVSIIQAFWKIEVSVGPAEPENVPKANRFGIRKSLPNLRARRHSRSACATLSSGEHSITLFKSFKAESILVKAT